MPIKEDEKRQFYLELEDGEYIDLGKSMEMVDIYQEAYISGEFPVEISIEISGEGVKDIISVLKRKILCNNWRKMHHMPMIRKQKLTQ